MQLISFPTRPFPLLGIAQAHSSSASKVLHSYKDLSNFAMGPGILSVCLRRIASESDAPEKVARVTDGLMRTIDKALNQCGGRVFGYELEAKEHHFDLFVLFDGNVADSRNTGQPFQ